MSSEPGSWLNSVRLAPANDVLPFAGRVPPHEVVSSHESLVPRELKLGSALRKTSVPVAPSPAQFTKAPAGGLVRLIENEPPERSVFTVMTDPANVTEVMSVAARLVKSMSLVVGVALLALRVMPATLAAKPARPATVLLLRSSSCVPELTATKVTLSPEATALSIWSIE